MKRKINDKIKVKYNNKIYVGEILKIKKDNLYTIYIRNYGNENGILQLKVREDEIK